jgi:hypothetical protein
MWYGIPVGLRGAQPTLLAIADDVIE